MNSLKGINNHAISSSIVPRSTSSSIDNPLSVVHLYSLLKLFAIMILYLQNDYLRVMMKEVANALEDDYIKIDSEPWVVTKKKYLIKISPK